MRKLRLGRLGIFLKVKQLSGDKTKTHAVLSWIQPSPSIFFSPLLSHSVIKLRTGGDIKKHLIWAQLYGWGKMRPAKTKICPRSHTLEKTRISWLSSESLFTTTTYLIIEIPVRHWGSGDNIAPWRMRFPFSNLRILMTSLQANCPGLTIKGK